MWLQGGTLCDVANLMSHRSPGVLGTRLFREACFHSCSLKDTLKTRNPKQLGPRPRDSPLATGATCVEFQGGKSHVLYLTVPYRTVLLTYRTPPHRTMPYCTVTYSTVPYHALLYRNVLCRGNPRNITELYRTVPYYNIVAPLATPEEYSPIVHEDKLHGERLRMYHD